MNKKLTVAIISGGNNYEREVSLTSGQEVFKAIDKTKYRVFHYDPHTDIPKIVAAASEIDFALILLHCQDGAIQGLLDLLGIPYQCSGILGSALASNKLISKRLFENAGFHIPSYHAVSSADEPRVSDYLEDIGFPVMVKPARGGSSLGISKVVSEKQLHEAIEIAMQYHDQVLLEEYIDGREITVGVLGYDVLRPLPVCEIILTNGDEFLDFKTKYNSGRKSVICPAKMSAKMTEKAKECAVKAHTILDCRGYSRTDMIMKEEQIYVLETNTSPGMTPRSFFPAQAHSEGIGLMELIDYLIKAGIKHSRSK